MTRCLTPAICTFALILTCSARGDAGDKAKEMQGPKDSKEFAMKAAEGGLFEVKLSQLAQQKAQSQDIKDLAKQLEQDHTQANTELAALAKQKNIDIPTDLRGECAEHYSAFQKLDGKDFDNTYLLFNVKDHLKDVMMFQNEAKAGTDPDVKAWAAKTVPALQKHTAHIGTVARGAGLPIDDLTRGGIAGGGHGDSARPAGSRIEGTQGGTTVPPRTGDR